MPAYSANPRFPLELIEDAAIRAHNARVVGATFLPTPPLRYLPGMAATADLPAHYRPVFLGADREYAEDEGWQTVHGGAGKPRYQRKNRKQRKWREVENPLFGQEQEQDQGQADATSDGAPRLRYRELPKRRKGPSKS